MVTGAPGAYIALSVVTLPSTLGGVGSGVAVAAWVGAAVTACVGAWVGAAGAAGVAAWVGAAVAACGGTCVGPGVGTGVESWSHAANSSSPSSSTPERIILRGLDMAAPPYPTRLR